MRLLLSGAIALVAVCRLAAGGEGVALSAADPMHALFRLLMDFGALGAFIIYLIWDKKKEREKRYEDSERWHALDRELISLVRECIRVIAENTSVLTELRRDVWRLIRKGGRRTADGSDTDIWHAGETGDSRRE